MAVSLAVAALLTGCGANRKNTELAESAKGLEGSEIRLLYAGDWITASEKRLAETFEAETGIHVEFVRAESDGYTELIMEKLKSGNCEDIFMQQSGPALERTYRIQDYALDLAQEEWAAYYDSFTANQTIIDDKLYGMTYFDTTTDYYLVYNRKLMSLAGVTEVPKDWDSFMDTCEMLKNSGVTPIYEPMADGWHQTMLWADMGQVFEVLRPGITVKLKNNMKTFAGDVYMQQAMYELKSLADGGYFGDSFLEDTYAEAPAALASGEYAMCMMKPGKIAEIVADDLNQNYSESDFGLMLLPLCDNQTLNIHPSGPTRFIYKGTGNEAAARLYLSFLANPESIQYMIDNEASIENLPFDAGQTPAYSPATAVFLSGFSDENSGMVLQDSVVYLNEQWDAIAADMAHMFSGKMKPEEVLKRIDERRSQIAAEVSDVNWTVKGE